MSSSTADGISAADGGTVELRGCSVNVSAGASLSAQGPNGMIDVRDGDQMTLAGDFQAGPGGLAAIELRHRNAAQVPITTGATFSIAPTIIHDTTLPNCDLDDDDVLNFDDNCLYAPNPARTITAAWRPPAIPTAPSPTASATPASAGM